VIVASDELGAPGGRALPSATRRLHAIFFARVIREHA